MCAGIGVAYENANIVQCRNNLKQISLACKAYAEADKDGMLPPDFKSLTSAHSSYADNAWENKMFTCPSSRFANEHIGDNRNRDFNYFGRGHKETELNAKTVLAVDRPGNHKGKFINVLFGDGHVEGVKVPKGTDLRALAAQRGWKIPEPK
jgi:prepilin-type processing-associated H-X9-DG protein